MWTCSKCHEKVDDEFEVCWSCGTTIEGVENPRFMDTSEEIEPSLDQMPLAGEFEDLVTVTSCSLRADAVAKKLHLDSKKIPAFLADELTGVVLVPILVNGFKIQVPAKDEARAIAALAEYDEQLRSKQQEREIEEGIMADTRQQIQRLESDEKPTDGA